MPAEQRSGQIRDTEPDPRRILTSWGAFLAEIVPVTAPILLMARDAASGHTELAALLEGINAARLERMTANARALNRHPGLAGPPPRFHLHFTPTGSSWINQVAGSAT